MRFNKIRAFSIVAVVTAMVSVPTLAIGAVGDFNADVGRYYTPHLNSNLKALVAGSGGVNCRGGDVCVKEVGDSATVSWEIQTTPLIVDDNESQIGGGTIIAVPSVLDNVTLETIALPEPAELESAGTQTLGTVREVSKPVKLVEQKTPLYGDAPYDDAAPVNNLSAPSLASDSETWQAYLYADPSLLDSQVPYLTSGGMDVYELSWPVEQYVSDSKTLELYEEIKQADADVYHTLRWNRSAFEKYIPYWVEAWKNADITELTYSPSDLLSLLFRAEENVGGFRYNEYDAVNLARAMTAVEAAHPEVLEPAEPLLGKNYVFPIPDNWSTFDSYKEDWTPLFLTDEDLNQLREGNHEYPHGFDRASFEQKVRDIYAGYEAFATKSDAHSFSSIENADLYNYIYIPASQDALGVSSFKLTGTITVESNVTYLPVRVWNTNTKCLLGLCNSLTSYDWAKPGALPDYSLNDAEVNTKIAGLQTDVSKGKDATEEFRPTSAATDGRLGSMQCAVTSEHYEGWGVLGADSEVSNRNIAQSDRKSVV